MLSKAKQVGKLAQNIAQTMGPTTLQLFKKCPTGIQTAANAITSSHNIVVAILFEMATNHVYISYCISCVFAVKMLAYVNCPTYIVFFWLSLL